MLDRLDPHCRTFSAGAADCVVIDPAAYAWKSAPFARPARNAAVVYELHVGSFNVPPGASQGTLASARDKLGELADLGVNVVEIMPVQAYGGNPAGWATTRISTSPPRPPTAEPTTSAPSWTRPTRRGSPLARHRCQPLQRQRSGLPLACYDGDCPDGSRGIYFFRPALMP